MADDFLSIMKVLPDPNAFMQGQQDAANLQQTQLQNQTGQFKLQQAQQGVQDQKSQDAAYHSAVGQFIQNPTAEGASNLQLQFPDQAKAIQDSWATRDKAQSQADMQQLANVYSLLKSGKGDAAVAMLQQRQAADKAAGRSEPMVDQLLQTALSDPDTAKGMAAYALASSPMGKDFADTLKSLNDGGGGTHVITAGGALVDDTGKELYKAADKTDDFTLTNSDGSQTRYHANGQPAGGGNAPGQRYTGGWTPRAANGGDNTDAAVNGKIAGAAKFLGVDPAADISGLSPMKIAQAMTLSEGGHGTIADRNNNPANLRNGDGSYKTFPTAQAGLNAAAALVARKLKNGQTTVQSMIEGLPTGSPASGGAHVVATSKGGDPASSGEDAATIDFYGQKVAAGGDMPPLGMGKAAAALRKAILTKAAQIQMGQGMTGADSNLLHADTKSAGIALTALQKTRNSLDPYLATFDGASAQVRQLAPAGVGGSIPVFNRWIQAGRKSIKGDPAVAKFDVAINAVANENAKIMSGASGGAVSSDSARHEAMSLINNAQNLDQLNGVLDQMHTDTQIRVKSLDDKQAQLRGIIAGKPQTSGHAAAPQPAHQGGVVHVQTRAQAMALPSGTKFAGPDGRVWTKH